MSQCHLDVTYSGNLSNSRFCILNTKDASCIELETCEKIIHLSVVPSLGANKNSVGLASFVLEFYDVTCKPAISVHVPHTRLCSIKVKSLGAQRVLSVKNEVLSIKILYKH